jgi:[ribosomal protein S5]-alanine N-acetyltransferase
MMQTERTIWTLLEEKDFPQMTEMSREPDTFRYIRRLQVMTEEEYQQYLLLKLEQIRLGKGYHWAVWLKTNGAFIGAVNLNPIGNSERLQIGCQLKRDYWGQGFASELTRAVMDFAVGEAGLREIYGVFEKDNIVSRRLLAKLGFSLVEETLTEQGVDIEIHRWSDAISAG